jgi:hypothetical protein
MKSSQAYRILSDRKFRPAYWATRSALGRLAGLYRSPHRPFARHVARDLARFLRGGSRPDGIATADRARAAAAWLMRAQDATPDDGASYGYFPGQSSDGDWKPSYPETTGYIIASLLDYARRHGDEEARARALRMARWEIAIQMPSGAVQGGILCPAEERTPAVFNTGMVLQGLCAAFEATGEAAFLDAGRRAGDFLVADIGPDGHYRTHGRFVAGDAIKTYNGLCSWALYRLGEACGDDRYREAAVRSVEASVGQQQPGGWFANNCLERPDAPLTHTIGYALQGILEVGVLAGRDDLIGAARRGTDPLVERTPPSGFLPGRFFADWAPASFSSCLTGNAQIAVVCYRLFAVTGEDRYREAADRLVGLLGSLQDLDSPIPGVNGAIAGSYPILGEYQGGGYPNWATKYFLDALMEQDRLEAEACSRSYPRGSSERSKAGSRACDMAT